MSHTEKYNHLAFRSSLDSRGLAPGYEGVRPCRRLRIIGVVEPGGRQGDGARSMGVTARLAAGDGIGARDCAEAHATASATKHQNKHRRRGMGLRMRQAKRALVAIFGDHRAQIIVISSDMTEVPHDRRAL